MVILCATSGAATIRNSHLELQADIRSDNVYLRLSAPASGRTWADGPASYVLRPTGGSPIIGLKNAKIKSTKTRLTVTGDLGVSGARVTQEFSLPANGAYIEERITLENSGKQPLELTDLAFGFREELGEDTAALRWVAVPYRRQVDGRLHDYSHDDLCAGRFANSSWRNDDAVADQVLSDEGKLRSEAWAWSDGQHGLLIAKYNQEMIEYSVAAVEKYEAQPWLQFGGAGLALYREPRAATHIAPGAKVAFGVTRYTPFDGDWQAGYAAYRAFLNQKGHALAHDYSPPLNWNELFDVGWYHSNPEELAKHYTREALFGEAAKARDMGCDLLYLDPGWEICEGTTLWDTKRLGPVSDFSRELRQKYGLKLAYRTIGRVYRDEFPNAWYKRREGQTGDYEMPRVGSDPEPVPVPLLTADGRRNLALLPEAKAAASSVIPGYAEKHAIAHLNDGYYNNSASWVSAADPSWVEIDLGSAHQVNEIAFGSEHQPQYRDRAVTQFDVLVATKHAADSAAPTWKKVFTYDGAPVETTTHFRFAPTEARCIRVVINGSVKTSARIDELEIYEAIPAPAGAVQPVRRATPPKGQGNPIGFWEVCTQSRKWQAEKIKRILAVTGGGVDFMMFDEFDWRGPCYDPTHGHPVPSTPEGHVRAVYGLIEAMRAKYPHVFVEAHDPVWPWSMRYTPTYFHQGFTHNRYQENWAFEFMWNPIADLRSGSALCLYYYNLGCDIPLYNHITMEGDNDACLSFWWYASTVRHLGIGGKKGLNSPNENETRYQAYKRAVADYNKLRPYYARGRFVGIDEMAHLHLHPTESSAVLNVYNITDAAVQREVRVKTGEVGLGKADQYAAEGCVSRVDGDALVLTFDLPPLTPAHAVIRKR